MEEKHRCQRQIEASQLKHQLQWLECERYQYPVKLLGDNDLLLQCCCQLLIYMGADLVIIIWSRHIVKLCLEHCFTIYKHCIMLPRTFIHQSLFEAALLYLIML